LKQRRGTLVLSTLVGGAFLRMGVAQGADLTYRFDIPAESLSQALTDFSQAAAQQIIYSENLVRGRKTSGLHGSYTATEALDALLAGPDLRADTNSSGVLMIRTRTVIDATRKEAPARENTAVQRTSYQPPERDAQAPSAQVASTPSNTATPTAEEPSGA